MTCDAMREALLVADLDELRGGGEGEVAVHVRGCAECRRDAERILAATASLGGAVRIRRWRRSSVILVPVAAAAGLAFFLWARRGPDAPAIQPPVVAQAPVVPPSAPLAPAVRPVTHHALRRLAGPKAFQPVPIAPVALTSTPILPGSPAQATEARKQPRLLPTSDPSITVLWLD